MKFSPDKQQQPSLFLPLPDPERDPARRPLRPKAVESRAVFEFLLLRQKIHIIIVHDSSAEGDDLALREEAARARALADAIRDERIRDGRVLELRFSRIASRRRGGRRRWGGRRGGGLASRPAEGIVWIHQESIRPEGVERVFAIARVPGVGVHVRGARRHHDDLPAREAILVDLDLVVVAVEHVLDLDAQAQHLGVDGLQQGEGDQFVDGGVGGEGLEVGRAQLGTYA